MIPRISRIRVLHPVTGNADRPLQYAVRIEHCEHECVVDRSFGRLRLRQRVVYFPRHVRLTSVMAEMLGVSGSCEPVTTAASSVSVSMSDPSVPTTSAWTVVGNNGSSTSAQSATAAGWCRVAAPNGIVLPLCHVVRKLHLDRGDSSSRSHSQSASRSKPAAQSPSFSVVLAALQARPADRPCLGVDLLANPALLNTLLDVPVWIAETAQGPRITIHYEAQSTRTVCTSSAQQPALATWEPHGAALRRYVSNKYGPTIDGYLHGFGVADGSEMRLYFQALEVCGAQSYLLDAESFLDMCCRYSVPCAPTLHVNETLRTIVNRRLGRRRPLRPYHEAAPASANALPPPPPTTTTTTTTSVDVRARRNGNTETDATSAALADEHDMPDPDASAWVAPVHIRHAYRFKEERPISFEPPAPLQTAPVMRNWRESESRAKTSVSATSATTALAPRPSSPHSLCWSGSALRLDDSGSGRDERRYGGVPDSRVDWAAAIQLVANDVSAQCSSSVLHGGSHRASFAPPPPYNVTGIWMIPFTRTDAARLLDSFPYLRWRCGAEVSANVNSRGACGY